MVAGILVSVDLLNFYLFWRLTHFMTTNLGNDAFYLKNYQFRARFFVFLPENRA